MKQTDHAGAHALEYKSCCSKITSLMHYFSIYFPVGTAITDHRVFMQLAALLPIKCK